MMIKRSYMKFKIQLLLYVDDLSCPDGKPTRFIRLPLLFRDMDVDLDIVYKKDLKFFCLRYLKFRPDVVLTVGPVPGAVAAFYKKIGLVRVPLVHDWTDDYVDMFGASHGIFRSGLLEYFTIQNSDIIVSPSKFRETRCKMINKKVKYIPHGVNAGFDKVKKRELGGKGKVKIVFAGVITRLKGTDKIAKAVNGLDCDLHLFGRINDNHFPTELFKTPNVHFHGLVNHKEMPGYIKAADILVITADDDCTLKMFDYVKAGKCILSIRGRACYFLTHGVDAYITDDLRGGLMELIKNKKLRTKLSKNVKKIKIRTWNEIAEEYINFLRGLI